MQQQQSRPVRLAPMAHKNIGTLARNYFFPKTLKHGVPPDMQATLVVAGSAKHSRFQLFHYAAILINNFYQYYLSISLTPTAIQRFTACF
jgi:hypothetical protein